MGRRYYCDYCNKTFIDDIEARKKHLNSSTHQKLRKEHYLACRDPQTILAEEIVRTPCRRYMTTGECPYLGSCKHTHYSQEELWQLKLEIDMIEQRKLEDERIKKELPSIESWLQKYNQKRATSEAIDSDTPNIWWQYPEKLEMIPDLPPSLIKFKPEHFKDSNFETWG